MKFRDLNTGDQFDFINDDNRILNSFYLTCTKVSARKYEDETGMTHRVGSIEANVYHVVRKAA